MTITSQVKHGSGDIEDVQELRYWLNTVVASKRLLQVTVKSVQCQQVSVRSKENE